MPLFDCLKDWTIAHSDGPSVPRTLCTRKTVLRFAQCRATLPVSTIAIDGLVFRKRAVVLRRGRGRGRGALPVTRAGDWDPAREWTAGVRCLGGWARGRSK